VVSVILGFPEPPARVTQALHHIQIVRAGDLDLITRLGLDQQRLPRPWDPAGCDRVLRRQLWEWCESVVAWVNGDYMWTPADAIPACWPQHPQLNHELPLLSCLRWFAAESLQPGPLEEWHRVVLPGFLDRMERRLQHSRCRTTGVHEPWPGQARYRAYYAADAVEARQTQFCSDTGTRTRATA
jgi:hypothetical protein